VSPPGHRTVAVDYFFNNDLEYLKTSNPEVTYTTSIMKTKTARYEIKGIEDMVPILWSIIKHAYDKDVILGVKSVSVKKLHGYGHLEEIMVKRTDQQLYTFKEGDFLDLHLNNIEDMLLLLGVESYQKKLNITKPQKTFPEIEFKEPYTLSYDPPGIIYEDLNKQKRVLVLEFPLDYNPKLPKRKWTAVDRKRSGLMIELIDKQLGEREIVINLERLVGARELEMDYKLMTRTL
ncbi:hypothetical protein Tco_1323939, partial [Tanacetum coccineum]